MIVIYLVLSPFVGVTQNAESCRSDFEKMLYSHILFQPSGHEITCLRYTSTTTLSKKEQSDIFKEAYIYSSPEGVINQSDKAITFNGKNIGWVIDQTEHEINKLELEEIDFKPKKFGRLQRQALSQVFQKSIASSCLVKEDTSSITLVLNPELEKSTEVKKISIDLNSESYTVSYFYSNQQPFTSKQETYQYKALPEASEYGKNIEAFFEDIFLKAYAHYKIQEP